MRHSQGDSKRVAPPFWSQVEREDWVKQAQAELKGKTLTRLEYCSREGINRKPLYLAEDLEEQCINRVTEAITEAIDLELSPDPNNSPKPRQVANSWVSRPDCSHADANKMHALIYQQWQRGERSIRLQFIDRHRAGHLDPVGVNDDEGPGCSWAGWLNLQKRLLNDSRLIELSSQKLEIVADMGTLGARGVDFLAPESWAQGLKVIVLFDPMAAWATWDHLANPMSELWTDWAQSWAQSWTQTQSLNSSMEAWLGISTVDYHEAGATSVDQLAYALATAVLYLRQAEGFGLCLDRMAEQMMFQFAVGRDFFAEIAKLRAFRVLWDKVGASCGISAAAKKVQLHACTSMREQSVYEPWVNALRGTLSSMAAVLARVDSLTTMPFDALAGGSESGHRLAANTQAILRRECGLDRVLDPLRGSFFMESMTEQIARAAWQKFQKIESLGGMEKFVASGEIGREIEVAAVKLRTQVASGQRVVVGVNRYANLNGDRLKKTYSGFHRPKGALVSLEPSREWRILREELDAQTKRIGQRPAGWIIGIGSARELQRNLDSASQVLSCSGFAIAGLTVYKDVATAMAKIHSEASSSESCVYNLCAQDWDDDGLVDLIREIRQQGAKAITLFGHSVDFENSKTKLDAIVDGILHRDVPIPGKMLTIVEKMFVSIEETGPDPKKNADIGA